MYVYAAELNSKALLTLLFLAPPSGFTKQCWYVKEIQGIVISVSLSLYKSNERHDV